ncbi:UNVERIFIED_CONTAM: hypothetical protein FKN15_069068 [Acipenser sinensis]
MIKLFNNFTYVYSDNAKWLQESEKEMCFQFEGFSFPVNTYAFCCFVNYPTLISSPHHPNRSSCFTFIYVAISQLVPHGNSPELVFNPVHVNDSGFYICRVNSGGSFQFSQWAQLEVCDITAVYGLLYYAGHGYENYGNSFMVPVDAPNPYRSANCLCVQSILKLMQEKETGLNVFLLDMCRKRNVYDDIIPNVEALRVTANIVFGYATCQDAEAFELNSTGFTNGVFIKFLKKRLLEDEKITVLLDKVAEDMGTFDPTKGKQALEIRSSLSEKRALTDPIQSSGCSEEIMARNLQWEKAHELPESMCLEFDCGVQIKLGFAAEFSNVMVIYTSIVKKPEDMTSCEAYVTNFTPDLDVDPKETNKVTPEETGSYLLSKSLPEHCLYTRLSSLQKLKGQLSFTVCLQGKFNSMDDLVDWRTEVNIGKPLIAKLDIHRMVRRNSCLQTCHMPHSPSHSPAHSPSHSPGVETHYHQHYPQHYQNSYLGVYHHNHPLMTMGGTMPVDNECCMYSNLSSYSQEGEPYAVSDSRVNIPIETTADINELQTSFIDSLEINNRYL